MPSRTRSSSCSSPAIARAVASRRSRSGPAVAAPASIRASDAIAGTSSAARTRFGFAFRARRSSFARVASRTPRTEPGTGSHSSSARTHCAVRSTFSPAASASNSGQNSHRSARSRDDSRARSSFSQSRRRSSEPSATPSAVSSGTRRRLSGSVRSAFARTRASRRSSFAPDGECRSRNRSDCSGLIDRTSIPCAARPAASGPRGVSIATAGLPRARSHRASARRPAPPCPNARCPSTAPEPSTTRATCSRKPQSTPANRSIEPSPFRCHARGHVRDASRPCAGARGADSLLGFRRGSKAGRGADPRRAINVAWASRGAPGQRPLGSDRAEPRHRKRYRASCPRYALPR